MRVSWRSVTLAAGLAALALPLAGCGKNGAGRPEARAAQSAAADALAANEVALAVEGMR